jgi:uncharacterized membrane protein YhaH (DUF805 family)
MQWYLAVLKKYVVFSGRAHRREYWMFFLINVIFTIVARVADSFLGTGYLLYGFYACATLLPSVAVGVRRLHDTDHSGWWTLIAFVPLLGAIVLLVFLIREGAQNDNRFGPSPEGSIRTGPQPTAV